MTKENLITLTEMREIKDWLFSHKVPRDAAYYLPEELKGILLPDVTDFTNVVSTPATHFSAEYNTPSYFDGIAVQELKDEDGCVYTARTVFFWFHDLEIMEQENAEALYYEGLELI